jgi:hypothetical protein
VADGVAFVYMGVCVLLMMNKSEILLLLLLMLRVFYVPISLMIYSDASLSVIRRIVYPAVSFPGATKVQYLETWPNPQHSWTSRYDQISPIVSVAETLGRDMIAVT